MNARPKAQPPVAQAHQSREGERKAVTPRDWDFDWKRPIPLWFGTAIIFSRLKRSDRWEISRRPPLA